MVPATSSKKRSMAGVLLVVSSLLPVMRAQGTVRPDAGPSHPSAEFKQLMQEIADGQYYPPFPALPEWVEDGKRYSLVEPAAAPAKGFEIVTYDGVSGEGRTVEVAAARFIPKGAQESLPFEQYTWSSDHTRLLLFVNSKKVWRRNTRGDFWVLDLKGGTLTQLGGPGVEPSSLKFAKFSPDGRMVAYVKDNNLYVEELAHHTIRALTADGSADIINGTSDWVNEEELDIRDGYRWSSDSRAIAFWRFDQTGVQEWTLIDNTSGPVPVTRSYHYPQAGTTNSATSIGVVRVDEPSKVTWLKLPGDAREHYVPHMDWVPHTQQIVVEHLDRLQRDDRIYLADAGSGDVRILFEDTSPTFVDTVGFHGLDADFTWLNAKSLPGAANEGGAKPEALLWFSERDGWRHAYSIALDGMKKPMLLTNFNADVIAPVALDQTEGALFFTASPDDPVRAYLYRSNVDGSGVPERLSAAAEKGTHMLYQASPDGRYAFEVFLTANAAPYLRLTHLADGHSVRSLGDYAETTARLAALETPEEFVQTRIEPHLSLSTKIIKPPHFDATKKYPVLTYVYGEPAAQTVVDGFEGQDLFLRAIAREGYVVLSFDNEGTPAPRGRDWRHAGYGSLGVLSTDEQAEAIKSFAASHTYIDTMRMAIWGWSGGGTNTLNMMFRKPGLYSTGIANAPDPEQARYDTIYQERYMGMPSTNAKGYYDGSAINFVDGLSGNLLIIHGSGDDNVHIAGTEDLVDRLIAAGKAFDYMVYPGRTHAIDEGKGTFVHNYLLIARYLEDHIPAGPGPTHLSCRVFSASSRCPILL